jgi:SAM-dependent methyltransferase
MPNYYATPELYDQIYASFRADIGYVVRLAREVKGPVLEVACGSGRLLLPMLEAGADADGFDVTPEMVEATRQRVSAKGLKSHVAAADMRDFTMPRRYRWILIGFNTFYHNLTQADQIATLRCCREHLLEGGSLSIIAFHPSVSLLANAGGAPNLAMDHDRTNAAGRIKVWDTIQPDTLEQINRVTRHVELFDAAGAIERTFDAEFTLRYCYAPEIELLLRAAGFSRWEVCTPFEKYTDPSPFDAPEPPRAGGALAWRAWKD